MTLTRGFFTACMLLLSIEGFAQSAFTVSVNVSGLILGPTPGLAEFSVQVSNSSTSDVVSIFDNITAPLSNGLADGAAFNVVIDFNPDNQTCNINGTSSGVISGSDVIVQVICDPPATASPAEPVPVPLWVLVLVALGVLGLGAQRLTRA